jgi:hypothetical protein
MHTQQLHSQKDVTRSVLWLFLLYALCGLFLDLPSSIETFFIRTPLNFPALGEVSMLIWVLAVSIIFFKILQQFGYERFTLPTLLLFFLLYYGEGIHATANAVQMKLWILGYGDALVDGGSYPDTLPTIDSIVLPIFKLLYFCDEVLGHFIEFSGIFLFFLLFYYLSFSPSPDILKKNNYVLAFASVFLLGLYMAWDMVEGQSVGEFSLGCLAMLSIKVYQRYKHAYAGAIGKVLESTFLFTAVLIFIWFVTIGKGRTIPQFFDTMAPYFIGSH